jgi:PAS domain S-box-containing protein
VILSRIFFATLPSLVVAFMIARGFLVRPLPGALMLACGSIFWGVGTLVAFIVGQNDPNSVSTIHNVCTWLAACSHLCGVILFRQRQWAVQDAGRWIGVAYMAALSLIWFVAHAVTAGWLPIFFVPGYGGTLARQFVLVSAIGMLLLSAVLLRSVRGGAWSTFANWYALALVLLAVGMFAFLIVVVFGSLLAWIARADEYVAGFYMLVAAVASTRESHGWALPAESVLHSNQERLRLLVEHAPVAVAMFDRNMRYLYASDRWLLDYNLGNRDLYGMSHYDIFPEIPEVWKEAHRKGMAGAVLKAECECFERADGSVQWIRWELRSWREPTGDVGGIIIYSEDVTGRKQAEDALHSSQLEMKAIVNSAMDGIITVDDRQKIVVFNMAAEKMFQCPAAEALGSPLDRFIPLEYREKHREHIHKFGASGITDRSMRSPGLLTAIRSNGEPFPIEATISHALVGKKKTYTVILRDITERKRTEEAMIRSEKLASVGRMAATIAHEINNPLMAVTNALFIAMTMEPQLARRHLEIADAELKRIAHITRQALGFCRESTQPTLTSVTAVLDSAVDLLKNKARTKGAFIEKQWDGDVQIIAVAGELRQVFTNLVANSLEAMDSNGNGALTLRVSTGAVFRDGRRGVRITIADNGTGIDKDAQQRIFEPFFTTKGEFGTGLGLWVSKQIIAKHGGHMRLRSQVDGLHRGSTFSILVPVEPAARSQSTGA